MNVGNPLNLKQMVQQVRGAGFINWRPGNDAQQWTCSTLKVDVRRLPISTCHAWVVQQLAGCSSSSSVILSRLLKLHNPCQK